jgi:hypothetical protein
LATWDLKELKDHIEKKYGEKQKNLSTRSLDSIFENQDFARYHYTEVKRLITEHMSGKETEKDYFRLVMSTDKTVRESEYQFSTSCKAHIISLLRHLHSIPDLLSHVIYFCLGFNIDNKNHLDDNKISLYNVKKLLQKDKKYQDLLESLLILTDSDDFRYLKVLGNHTKHRANVIPKLSYSLEFKGEKVYKFSFEAFNEYPQKPAVDFLNNEFNRGSEQIIIIGNKINKLVLK